MSRLRIGIMLTSVAVGEPAEIGSLARHVEDTGLEGIFVGDHLAPVGPILDSTVTLATAAAATKRVHLGFSVLTLALRPVAWAAKQVASLQQVSGNRVILGVGAGGELHGRAAWEAVGISYDERGLRTEEGLAVLPDLIAGQPTRLGNVELTLKPGAERPPIWIGGMSRAAIRRSAVHGDAWFPSMLTASSVADGGNRLRETAEKAGRPTPAIALGGFAALGTDVRRSEVDDLARSLEAYGVPAHLAPRIPITGSVSQAAERFAEYADAGVTYLVLGLPAVDWRRQCELVAEARTHSEG